MTHSMRDLWLRYEDGLRERNPMKSAVHWTIVLMRGLFKIVSFEWKYLKIIFLLVRIVISNMKLQEI